MFFCDICFQQFLNAEVLESGLFLARGRHAPVDVQKQNYRRWIPPKAQRNGRYLDALFCKPCSVCLSRLRCKRRSLTRDIRDKRRNLLTLEAGDNAKRRSHIREKNHPSHIAGILHNTHGSCMALFGKGIADFLTKSFNIFPLRILSTFLSFFLSRICASHPGTCF